MFVCMRVCLCVCVCVCVCVCLRVILWLRRWPDSDRTRMTAGRPAGGMLAAEGPGSACHACFLGQRGGAARPALRRW